MLSSDHEVSCKCALKVNNMSIYIYIYKYKYICITLSIHTYLYASVCDSIISAGSRDDEAAAVATATAIETRDAALTT